MDPVAVLHSAGSALAAAERPLRATNRAARCPAHRAMRFEGSERDCPLRLSRIPGTYLVPGAAHPGAAHLDAARPDAVHRAFDVGHLALEIAYRAPGVARSSTREHSPVVRRFFQNRLPAGTHMTGSRPLPFVKSELPTRKFLAKRRPPFAGRAAPVKRNCACAHCAHANTQTRYRMTGDSRSHPARRQTCAARVVRTAFAHFPARCVCSPVDCDYPAFCFALFSLLVLRVPQALCHKPPDWDDIAQATCSVHVSTRQPGHIARSYLMRSD